MTRRLLPMVLGLIVLMASVGFSPAANAQANHIQHSANDEIATIAALREGGNVIFFRHERTDVLRLDDERFVMADCATQRNLSVAGVANAQQTGQYIRHLEIPIGDVWASPMCRCLETARFAFGRVRPEPRLMGDWAETGRTMTQAGADLRALVAENVRPGTNTVMVAHFSNAFQAFGVRLLEGDALVVTLDARGAPRVVGLVGSHRWGDIIRDESGRSHRH